MTQPGSQTLVLARLEQLVRVESPSRDAAASRQITDLLVAWFTELGLVARRIQSASGVHLIIDDPGDGVGAPILLVGHSDTVWEHGDIETRVPWT